MFLRAYPLSAAVTLALVTNTTLADQAPAQADCAAARSNRAPTFDREYSYTAHPRRRLLVTLDASDPDGDPLHYSASDLPDGASLDEKLGRFTWTPTSAQIGYHSVRVVVSDGRTETKTTLFLRVDVNHAPARIRSRYVTFTGIDFNGSRKRYLELAEDNDGDPLAVRVLTAPPGDAMIHVEGNKAVLDWSPTETDIGDHPLVCEISDGQVTTSLHSTVTVIPAPYQHDWLRAFLMGGGAAGFVTHRQGEVLLGGAFEVTLFADRQGWVEGLLCRENSTHDVCHASHRRLYGQFEVLHSPRANAPALFAYGLGFAATFESAPLRRAFIPLYGVEIGGLYRSGLGHRVATRPYLGAHLWASDTLWVTAALGYRVVPAEMLDFSGPTFSLTAMINPW